MSNSAPLHIVALPSKNPEALTEADTSGTKPNQPPAHWVGNPPTHFKNPWPSFLKEGGFLEMLQVRFGSDRNFVPVPETREELVKVQKPDWGRSQQGWSSGIKATWLGHAGVLVELASPLDVTAKTNGTAGTEKLEKGERRGLRILFDAVFSDRTSPVTWAGPKRYTPLPCSLEDLPEIDIIATSHDHYDHMDLVSIKRICERQHAAGKRIHFFAGLNNARHFLSAGAGILPSEITECDWWDSHSITFPGAGALELTCVPTQHFSGRSLWDRGQSLWCGWAVTDKDNGKKLYFAGDTAYKTVGAESECPVFKQIGEVFGGFDLAWIPIGLYSPQRTLSAVHVCPEDSLRIHRDVRSRRSMGMHYGTFRGGISQYYEDVRDPPRRWQEAAEREGMWGSECGLCDVGETVVV